MATDVLVVGGGVIGLSIADRLAGEGLRVVVVERDRCGQQASWASAGVLTPCSWHRTDPLARMHFDALWRYEAWANDLHERSGIDPEYWRCGAFKPLLDENRRQMARRESETAHQRHPADPAWVTTLDTPQARELEPHVTPTDFGAQLCRLTAQVRPPRLMAALVECCRKRGVEIREGLTVQELIRDQHDAPFTVQGVLTTAGEIRSGTVIVCAGAWSWQIDPLLQQHTPVYPAAGQILLIEQPNRLIKHMVAVVEDRFYSIPRRDGLLLIGSTLEPQLGYHTKPTVTGWHKLTRQALQHIPLLAEAKILQSWVGLRPGTPDRRPYMGRVPGSENLWVATGHYRTGMVLAPITAEIIAEQLMHGRCAYDLRKCAPGREFPVQADFTYLPWKTDGHPKL
ncbi:MAG: Glycine oxidase [Phycisphaerae bacterium]|nr:Glycine oxidase [Phycisphaerae bacterium]